MRCPRCGTRFAASPKSTIKTVASGQLTGVRNSGDGPGGNQMPAVFAKLNCTMRRRTCPSCKLRVRTLELWDEHLFKMIRLGTLDIDSQPDANVRERPSPARRVY